MGTRGRKSAAELAIARKVVEIVPRPAAPSELTDEEAAEWEAVICSEAADWIPRGAFGSLIQYCRHVVAARRVAQMIDAIGDVTDKSDGESDALAALKMADCYDKLLKMQERESRALSSLATRLRLTPQSRYTPSTAGAKGRFANVRKPWQSD